MAAPSTPEPGDLVAVRLPPSDRWVGLIETLWEKGAAILPIDHRHPAATVDRLLATARPALMVDARGWTRLDHGMRVASGVGLVMATSGTTAAPKLAELTVPSITAALRLSTEALGIDTTVPWLCPLPLAHMGGLLVLLRAVLQASPVFVAERVDAEMVTTGAARCMSIVPTMLERLLRQGVDLHGFERILVGGGPLSGALAERAGDAGVPIVSTYGQTESCGGVVYDGVPFREVAVRCGTQGEIQLQGPTLMQGYRLDASATAMAFTSDGWLRTGDAGVMEDGQLRVDGRQGDVIVTGGEKVWPADVEAALTLHPGIADVVVGGEADEEWGARVVAYIVPRDPTQPPRLQELRDMVSTRLPRHMAPRRLVVLSSLDRTLSGKLRRRGRPG